MSADAHRCFSIQRVALDVIGDVSQRDAATMSNNGKVPEDVS